MKGASSCNNYVSPLFNKINKKNKCGKAEKHTDRPEFN